jgi:CBS domain-containing protein
VIELCLQAPDAPTVPFTWLAFGSEGRLEQTISTDQDNGLLFTLPAGTDADSLRAQLLPFARRVNAALARCGFPLCAGNIMAGNPQWCLSLEEWKAGFAAWIHRGDAPVLLMASIFFDFRPLYGPEDPVRELREWLITEIRSNRAFLRQMVANALANRPPLGLLGDFVLRADGDGGTLDLKINGATPFVDAARILGLAAGSAETNTVARLRAAGSQWQMDSAEIDAWVQAFLFIQLLRLRQQHEQRGRGEVPGNRIAPEILNPLDRRILKEAFRQARKLQSRLETYFQF